jgi:hypothetical protein
MSLASITCSFSTSPTAIFGTIQATSAASARAPSKEEWPQALSMRRKLARVFASGIKIIRA